MKPQPSCRRARRAAPAMLCCLAALPLAARADVPTAEIGQVEYFYGLDPGPGNGTVLPAMSNTLQLTAATTGLAPGVHTLYLRTRPIGGEWGPKFPVTVTIEGSSGSETPAAVQFAWLARDVMPDWQSATMPPGGGATVSASFSPPLTGSALGTATLAIRSLDSSGTPGIPFLMPVAVVPDSFTGHTPAATSLVAFASNAAGVIPGSAVTVPLGQNPPSHHSLTLPLGSATAGPAEVVAYLTNADNTPSPQASALFAIVVEGTNGYNAWRDTPGRFTLEERADDAVSGPAADPDQDGHPNQTEFAFGGNPHQNSAEIAPVLETTGETVVLRFRQLQGGSGHRAYNYTANGVRYSVQSTTNLNGPWLEGGSEAFEVLSIQSNGDGTDTVRVAPRQELTAGQPAFFMRVKVQLL